MAADTNGNGTDMKQATDTYAVFMNLLKLLIGVSIVGIVIVLAVYIY